MKNPFRKSPFKDDYPRFQWLVRTERLVEPSGMSFAEAHSVARGIAQATGFPLRVERLSLRYVLVPADRYVPEDLDEDLSPEADEWIEGDELECVHDSDRSWAITFPMGKAALKEFRSTLCSLKSENEELYEEVDAELPCLHEDGRPGLEELWEQFWPEPDEL